jgi:hypothetical protein
MLEPTIISQNAKRFKEKLRYPWTLDEVDGLFQSFDNGYKEDCK